MKEELRINENTVEEPEGLRLLLTQVGLKHIAETLQQLPQSTYEAITVLMCSVLNHMSPKYQQVGWSLVLATALNACTGIEQASAQSKTVTPDQPGKPTLVTPTPTKEARKTPTVTPTATPQPEATATPTTVEVIDVAGGINRRKAPDGPVIDTTPGTTQEITIYKRTKAQPVKAGGYTWYEATDGDQIFWVALLEGKVTLRTEQVSTGTGGEQSEAEILAAAQAVAPDAVKVAVLPDGNRFAVNAADMIVARVDLGGTGQWYALAVAEPTPEIETGEKSSLEQTLFKVVPDEIKDQVEALEFDEKKGYWLLPDGIHAYLPLKTDAVATVEQGTFIPEDGFTIENSDNESTLSLYVGPDAMIKSLDWAASAEQGQQLITIIQKALSLPDGTNFTIVWTRSDITGRNPKHLGGVTKDFFEGTGDIEKELILFDTETNAQVIIARDEQNVIEKVVVFVARSKNSFAEFTNEQKPRYAGYEGVITATQAVHAFLYRAGNRGTYITWAQKDFGPKVNSLYRKDPNDSSKYLPLFDGTVNPSN
jgi:hypothetical protein